MRHAVIAAAVLLMQGIPAAQASDVYVGVSVAGQVSPGVYGRVEIGNTPPILVYPQPVIVMPPPYAIPRSPIYMHVPPGHAKNWAKHCYQYNACNQPVYFVKSPEYEPGYQNPGRGHGRKDKKHGRD